LEVFSLDEYLYASYVTFLKKNNERWKNLKKTLESVKTWQE